MLLVQSDATAAKFKATLEEIVDVGTDVQDVFGIPGPSSYAGMPFTAIWTIDTSLVSHTDRCEQIAD